MSYSMYNGNCDMCVSSTGANGYYCLADATCHSDSMCGSSVCGSGGTGTMRCAASSAQCSPSYSYDNINSDIGTGFAVAYIISAVVGFAIFFTIIAVVICLVRRSRSTTVVVAAAPAAYTPVNYGQPAAHYQAYPPAYPPAAPHHAYPAAAPAVAPVGEPVAAEPQKAYYE